MVSFKTTLLALAGAATVSADYWINVTDVPWANRRKRTLTPQLTVEFETDTTMQRCGAEIKRPPAP